MTMYRNKIKEVAALIGEQVKAVDAKGKEYIGELVSIDLLEGTFDASTEKFIKETDSIFCTIQLTQTELYSAHFESVVGVTLYATN